LQSGHILLEYQWWYSIYIQIITATFFLFRDDICRHLLLILWLTLLVVVDTDTPEEPGSKDLAESVCGRVALVVKNDDEAARLAPAMCAFVTLGDPGAGLATAWLVTWLFK
jgi:hypothetical protein